MARKKLYDEHGNQVKGKIKKPFYKKVWFWILVLIVVGVATTGGDEEIATDSADDVATESIESTQPKANVEAETTTESESTVEPVVVEEPVEEATSASADDEYQGILDDYTKKLKEAAPILVEEYNAEYPSNQNGLEGLAELSNDKISKLAELSNEGVSEMADVHFTNGSGKYEDYEAWAGKLMEVYMTEAEQITDAYMNSAQ
ncbi:hypothetical protein [Carnobacterium jeotgali]|uniref:hypothetical protein n=1 Tax=Carnobacterium jeotgali TaxID=545534 RepID=UPI003C720A64